MGGVWTTNWTKQARASARKSARRLGRYSTLRFTNRRRRPSGSTVNYAAYINSEDWKAKRQEYILSDLPKKCLACGSDEFQLHHVTYERLGYEWLSDLVPLCECCHKRLHKVDRCAGSNGLSGLRKALIYDFSVGTSETDELLAAHIRHKNKESNKLNNPKKRKRKPRFR